MKKIGLLLIVVSFLLYSCTNEDQKIKKEIIGSFAYSFTDNTDEDITVNMEGKETFSADGKIENQAVLSINMNNSDFGNINFKYNIKLEGTYNIKDSYIIYEYDANSTSFEYIETEASSEENAIFTEILRAVIDDQVIPEMQAALTNSSKVKVIELNDEQLVKETIFGEKTAEKRI